MIFVFVKYDRLESYAVTNHGQTSFTEARDAVPHEAITCIIGEYLHELG